MCHPVMGKEGGCKISRVSQVQMLFKTEARTLPSTAGFYIGRRIVKKHPSVKGGEHVYMSRMHCINWT